MKILSFIFTLLFLLPSYSLSFLCIDIDNTYEISSNGYSDGMLEINGERNDVEQSFLNGKIIFDFKETNCDWFNYFGVKYTLDAYIKGEIFYTALTESHSENFFLEPGENAVFYSFIDGILENKKAKTITKITFEALDKSDAELSLLGLGLFNREIPDEYVYIESDGYKIGVNLIWGGALSYLEDTDSKVQAVKIDGKIYVDSNAARRYSKIPVSNHINLINRFDAGRLVQQSYYGTYNYDNGEFMGQVWNYNPVQGGNQFNENSKIVDLICTSSSIYIKCRPLDWAKFAEEISPSYMEATYTIANGVVKGACRFVDFSGLESNVTTQEMPAFYCIEPFNRFVYYAGDKPWTNDENLSYENDLIFWPDAGYPHFNSTENWAAFIGEFDDSFGIGLYVPNDASFLAGVFDKQNTTERDPSADDSTSYIAAVQTLHFESFKPIEYEYCLATGSANEIREKFGGINK